MFLKTQTSQPLYYVSSNLSIIYAYCLRCLELQVTENPILTGLKNKGESLACSTWKFSAWQTSDWLTEGSTTSPRTMQGPGHFCISALLCIPRTPSSKDLSPWLQRKFKYHLGQQSMQGGVREQGIYSEDCCHSSTENSVFHKYLLNK